MELSPPTDAVSAQHVFPSLAHRRSRMMTSGPSLGGVMMKEAS